MRKMHLKYQKLMKPLPLGLLFLLIFGGIFCLTIIRPSNAAMAEKGTFYASAIDNRPPVMLNGEWEFYEGQVLFPSDFNLPNEKNLSPRYRRIPGRMPSTYGYGTYRMTFEFVSTGELFALKLSGVQGSARVYVDGIQVSVVGFPSTLSQSAEASKDSQYIIFPMDIMRRTHEIIIQVSNYHYYQSGITAPVYFGTQTGVYRLSSQFKFAESVGIMSVGVLSILLLFILILKIQMGNMLSLLLFTLSLGFHLVYSGSELIISPVSSTGYQLLSRINLIDLGLIGFFLLLVVNRQYTKHSRTWYIYTVYRIIFLVLAVFTVISPENLLPWMHRASILYLAASFLYAFIVLLARMKDGSYGALTQFLALGFCAGFFALQVVNSLGYADPSAYTFSYIVILIAHVASQLAYVALRVSRIYTGNARLAQRMVISDKLKDEFVTTTSHELRTPLHGMINIIESVAGKLPGKSRENEDLKLALTLARRMSSVVSDLYGYQNNSDYTNLKLHPVNLDIEVNALIEIFHYTLDKPSIAIKNNLSSSASLVYADEARLWQILNNLIGNAVKYTESGMIKLSSKRQGNKTYISVTDTGIGMSMRDAGRIFDKSVRLSEAERKAEGVGIGLYLVRQLVEQMGGSIFVEWSTPGRGTCITFTLNSCEQEDYAGSENQEAGGPAKEYPFTQNYLEQMHSAPVRILAVDDNPDNLKIIRNMLEDCSFTIDCTQNGGEALKLIDRAAYDMMILDVMMPDMSGFEVCRTVRERYSHFELPILLLTACDSTEEIMTGFWAGANDYVVKPADRVELRARVFSLIALHQSVKSAMENELLFLQAQIRPHFLYNAFNTISAIALSDGPKASALIDDLAVYLRGCFGKDMREDLIMIREELHIVDAYVRIEEARFGNRLSYESKVETNRMFLLPPLTIQPLVENSIRHASLNSYKPIHVELYIREENGDILIRIRDNGSGMDEDKVSAILADEKGDKQSGIGLRNVNRRLKLHYGVPLSISSCPQGTEIRIRLPLSRLEFLSQNDKTEVNV